jgi:hypothetical protein
MRGEESNGGEVDVRVAGKIGSGLTASVSAEALENQPKPGTSLQPCRLIP